jgi:hypothetical protein
MNLFRAVAALRPRRPKHGRNPEADQQKTPRNCFEGFYNTNSHLSLFLSSGLYRRYRNPTGSVAIAATPDSGTRKTLETRGLVAMPQSERPITAGEESHLALKQISSID